MKQATGVCALILLVLSACDQEAVDVDSKMVTLAAASENYFKENRDAIRAQSDRLFRESPELASYLTLADATRAILTECEEVCKPVRIVRTLGDFNLNLGQDGCPANQSPIGRRIEDCGNETDSGTFDSCLANAISGGACN